MRNFIYFLIGLMMTGCLGSPRIKQGVVYPNMISPIYYLDKIQINNPVVALIDSIAYITTESILKDSLDEKNLLKRKGVIRYLTPNLSSNKRFDYAGIYETGKTDPLSLLETNRELLYVDENLIFQDSLGNIAVYCFDIKPQYFLLTLIARVDNEIMTTGGVGELANDYIIRVEYSNDYILTIAPIYNNSNARKLHIREYRRLNDGKDPDWTYYLPNWLQNLYNENQRNN